MKAWLERLRYLAIIAVAGLAVTMVATFGWSGAKTARLISKLVNGGWRDDRTVVDLLEVIDIYLLAIVQMIVVLGVYELFIGRLNLPAWLRARSLDDLKKSIVDVLIVFVGIKGVEALLSATKPMDALVYTGAVAVLIGSLSLFLLKPRKPDRPSDDPNHTEGPAPNDGL
jgi:uncharacterized membrane protein YqhA